uniref:Uncharacterized protein n=1 Tax=Romanomermis culicivorax TaxID=13658 RepID=A0A915KIL3_ROMCU
MAYLVLHFDLGDAGCHTFWHQSLDFRYYGSVFTTLQLFILSFLHKNRGSDCHMLINFSQHH